MRTCANRTSLLLTAVLLGACTDDLRCRSKTLLIKVTIDGAADTADALSIDTTIDSGPNRHASVARPADMVSGTVEIDFPSGYPSGKTVNVTVTATKAGVTLASRTFSSVASRECMVGHVNLGSSSPSADLGNSDLQQDSGCASSVENCFNGLDDDCNGVADCADPACQSQGECVPDVPGAIVGTQVDATTACPAQFSDGQTDLHSGLSAGGPDCTGCTCTGDIGCSVTIYDYATTSLCSVSDGNPEGTITETQLCVSRALDIGVHTGTYMTVNKPCIPGGSAVLSTPSWSADIRFCQTRQIGGGCSPGNICVPQSASHCELAAGVQSCAPGYSPVGTGMSWYTGFSDHRSCGSCSCGDPSGGDCTKRADDTSKTQNVTFYSGGCGGTPYVSLGPGSKICNVSNIASAFGWENFNPLKPTCTPNTMVFGTLTPTGEQTLCCK